MHSVWKYFHRKKLDDPAELDKNTGRYCDKKFHGLSDSQEIVHTIQAQFRFHAGVSLTKISLNFKNSRLSKMFVGLK